MNNYVFKYSAFKPIHMGPNLIVCGDIMVDHNVYTAIEKLANEAPIPVFNTYSEEYQPGGCGNVVKNLASLGCGRLHVFSAIGNDENGKRLLSMLNDLGVVNHVKALDTYTTVTKQRFFCDNRIVFRCDTDVKNQACPVSFSDEIESILNTEKIDCIILSDYNKGVLHRQQCQEIIRLANNHGVFTCVDPKNDYTKYIGCTLIKPNRREAYEMFNLDRDTPVELLHKRIYEMIGCRYSVVTLAENGITLYDGKSLIHETPTVHKIIDVTGAGDIVSSILGYYTPMSTDVRGVLKLATRIATRSVEFPGTYTIKRSDVELTETKIVTSEQLKHIKERCSSPIVFTNGCFDLLHNGHIKLFKFCKERGTTIVGLNSDDSIRRLKGPSRPINTITTRLAILESIQYIDYIVVFDEDTPFSVIKELTPDVLVKGGDYDVSSICGREFAKETIVCEFVKDTSTTLIIEKIKESV
jgi:D-beta-D-heptose 7-phosphate kinase/D-beta-D-heptose 1-phosphate adenosyltransferase